MSDKDKVENCTLNSQDLRLEEAKETTQCDESDTSKPMNKTNLNMNESQDFHLIDTEDMDDGSSVDSENISRDSKLHQDKSGISESIDTDSGILSTSAKDTNVCISLSEANATEKSLHADKESKNSKEEHDVLTNNSTNIVGKHEILNDCNLESKENVSDEEDEIIQATPPQNYMSPKTFKIELTNLKRRATSFDEPINKIQRTSSHEDALIFDKKKSEREDDQYDSDESSKGFSTKEPIRTNVIIEETQDIIGNEPSTENTENTTENLETTHSGNVHCKKDKVNKCDDKNDNTNGTIECKEVNDITIEENSQAETVSMIDNTVPSSDVKQKDEIPVKDVNDSDKAIESEIKDNVQKEISHCKSITEDNYCSVESMQNTSSDIKGTKNSFNDTENLVQEITLNKETDKDSICTENIETPEEITSYKKIENDRLALKPLDSNPNVCNSRKSIEVIYDRMSQDKKFKPKELIEIDEAGEKIVLDSSEDDSQSKITEKTTIFDNTNTETIYKSCYDTKSSSDFSYKSVEGMKESSNSKTDKSESSNSKNTDATVSVESDTFSNDAPALVTTDIGMPISEHNLEKQVVKQIPLMSKTNESTELLSISDNDSCTIDDNVKNKSTGDAVPKSLQMEREIGFYVRLKCLLQLDENTKEFLSKELTAVHCEPIVENPIVRQKTEDTSASLADISGNDNKDTSPGSVNSNPQMFTLNPSRLSFISTISSSSSASSAASLVAKLAMKDNTYFPLPRGPVKHAKKLSHDTLSGEKQTIDETFDRLTKEWKNNRLLTATLLSCANTELNATDSYNISNERLEDQLQKIHCSTPEVKGELELNNTTPKTTRKGKSLKRPRSKISKSGKQLIALNKDSPDVLLTPDPPNNRKKAKLEKTESAVQIKNNTGVLHDSLTDFDTDKLIGKEVFAKWSDNNYYAGTVVDKVKTKYKVNFFDGKNKVLIEDFIIPIPQVLNKGLSVYAITKNDNYGSCGIIIDNQMLNDEIHYLVETDEGERIKVQVKNIFLSPDQAHVLKESNSETKSLPSTPRSSGNITLENMIEGKRRSRRIGTPIYLTPKSKINSNDKSVSVSEPSVSGTISKPIKETLASDVEGKSSDSSISIKDETVIHGTQPELFGTANEQIVKGPRNRIKGRMRNKRKLDDEETIANLGSIPDNSNIFEGMSFILTYTTLEHIDRYNMMDKCSSSDTGTETEEIWVQKPFVRERLKAQILGGGGKLYEDFKSIPEDEYKNTKHITNLPNCTEKGLLCLSVGIPAYNHNWIIRCCQQNKLINPAEEELPAGWSLEKQSYVEMFRRKTNKPLTEIMVIIPLTPSNAKSSSYWRQVCENAGAIVLLADNAGTMEGFGEGTIVLSCHKCPSWAIDKANNLQIPILSTTWVTQCLIEGRLCAYDKHPCYKYNCINT